jgi:hypothetical protein
MKLVGERRALAAIVFAIYFLLYLALAMADLQPGLDKALYALAGVYGLAFFALVAGYFWARWYAVGVGLYGIITAAVGMWQIGPEPILVFIGATHGAATLALWGNAMSEGYDGQTAWREKLHMDESSVQRLGRSVIRAGVSLPMVLLYALAPKPGSAELIVALVALGLVGFGFRAMVRLRTWGVLAVGVAGGLLVGVAGIEMATTHANELAALKPALGGALLLAAAAPWLRPIARYVR